MPFVPFKKGEGGKAQTAPSKKGKPAKTPKDNPFATKKTRRSP